MIKNIFFETSNLKIIYETGTYKIIDVGISIYKVVFTPVCVVLLLSWEELNNTEFHNRNIVIFPRKSGHKEELVDGLKKGWGQ